jgi:hypothetical protein
MNRVAVLWIVLPANEKLELLPNNMDTQCRLRQFLLELEMSEWT